MCDKDLALSLSQLGVLTDEGGHKWTPNSRFVESVGALVKVNNRPSIILAHLKVVSLKRQAYVPAVSAAVEKIVTISNWHTNN